VTLVHSIIAGNVVMILFNFIGMAAGLRLPPMWIYAATWVAIIASIFTLTNT
jgi:hypothetical protein